MSGNKQSNKIFQYQLRCEPNEVIEAVWSGHVNPISLHEFCRAVSQASAHFNQPTLLIDARSIPGYDNDAVLVARRWAKSAEASKFRLVVVLAESQLTAAHSPAAALAPSQRLRLAGSRRTAIALIEGRSPSSGLFAVNTDGTTTALPEVAVCKGQSV